MKKMLLLSAVIIPVMLFSNLNSFKSVDAIFIPSSPNQVVNGDFETGNLEGWQRFGIWKTATEPNMLSFDPSLVHNGTYFGTNPYGRDGDYQLGITSSTIIWEGTPRSEETMGNLRSSNFTLSGSRWISFKLGGGKGNTTAYMSVRTVSNNAEIARFGNPNFNNTGIATTQYGSAISNAEAFLFQYYFDLSSLASTGTALYIVLTDASANDWCILSADSFVTYYASAPTPGVNQTAVNIVPSIGGITTASNTILNGTFDSNLDNWTTAGTGWYQSSARAYSNNGGDVSTGVIRSSAFTVTTNNVLKVDWSGGLKWDKQIYISIKQVSSNIEMLRFVVRTDLLNKEDNNFDNHLCDLSSLSSSDKFYVEFVDNKSNSWGMMGIDNVTLQTTYTPVGDRAVQIANLASSYPVDFSQEGITYGGLFLEQTASSCSTENGGAAPWTNLSTSYGTLSNSAKDYFTSSGTIQTTVVAARTRYLFMVNKYDYGINEAFVKNSSGTSYTGVNENVPVLIETVFGFQQFIFVGMIFLSILCISMGRFLFRKIVRK